jgi:hypothetical protein
MSLYGVFGRNGHIVEKTKAHGFVAASVMSWRPHCAKGIFQIAGNDSICGF